uniref:ATP synthase complex subunit 8 n=1 Tax=Propalticus sp. PRO01 TaxID=1205574 RepID=A0A0S2MQA1_9CUCU|nr:ATP synthase F0 subunit 8 [Propalticus sp. PRO01]
MPQMAPLSWVTLLIYFILVFLLFNILNYFSFIYQPKIKLNFKTKLNQYNWKW